MALERAAREFAMSQLEAIVGSREERDAALERIWEMAFSDDGARAADARGFLEWNAHRER